MWAITGCVNSPADPDRSAPGGGKADDGGGDAYVRFHADPGDTTEDPYLPHSFEATEHASASEDSFGRWIIQGSSSVSGSDNPTVSIYAPHASGTYACSRAIVVVYMVKPSSTSPAYLSPTRNHDCELTIDLDSKPGSAIATATGTLQRGAASVPFTLEVDVPDFEYGE